MANGSRNELMGGLRRTSTSSVECDVGLGLKMQPTESLDPCKSTMAMLPPPPHRHQNQHPTSQGTIFSGDDDENGSDSAGGGGGAIFCNTSYQVACLSDIYDAGLGAAASSVTSAAVLPRTWHPFTTPPDIRGGMPVSGKILFTASQWQELERQTLICKYIMASVPVPPELLLPFSENHCPAPALGSQSSTSALSGSDPEPWRCRRTDGKKWRCSRNAVPDQKYCERHAHKSRTRSRKPVEIRSHNADTANNYTQPPLSLATNISSHPSRKQNAQFPTTGFVASYDQTRGIEWFTKDGDGVIPVSTCNQQWQHLMHSSSRLERSFQPDYRDKQDPLTLLDNVGGKRLENNQLNGQYCNSILDPKMESLQGNLNAHTAQTTRHFIDAWSAAEKGASKIYKRATLSSGMKVPFSSLTLSMPGENEIDEEDGSADTCMGMMMGLERNTEEAMKSQWLNPVTWMGTTPGGPLGEALCLGVATSSTKGPSNMPSPHGYSNSNSTTTSNCSRSSCEDGGQAFNFIGGNQ